MQDQVEQLASLTRKIQNLRKFEKTARQSA